MTATTWLLVLLVAWFAFGAIQAMYLGRRGFDGISWFLIGTVLGPLSVLVALNCVRRDERLSATTVRAGEPAGGGVDVLVGFDGSPESLAAMHAVQETFGPRLGRVALVSVLHFDDPPEHERTKRTELERAGLAFDGLRPELLIVRGHPSTALAEEARAGGYQVIAIGATGHGHAHLFGSAAKELIQRSTVPVLVAGQRVATASTSEGSPS